MFALFCWVDLYNCLTILIHIPICMSLSLASFHGKFMSTALLTLPPPHVIVYIVHWIQSGLIVFAKLCNNVKQSSAPSYSNLTFSKFRGWEDFVEFMEISLLNWFLIPRSLNFLQIGNIIHCRLNFLFVSIETRLGCGEMWQRAHL